MLPTTLNQWIGFIVAAAGAVVMILKGWRWYLDTQLDIVKSKNDVDVAKYNAEVAKHNAEILTASQVVQLMNATRNLEADMLEMREENKDRDENLTKAMDKLETNFQTFQDMFQKFLVARLNQFEQTLIKQ
jgi:hypothetical protein